MKRYKKALLHVGPDKTGSSSIQIACDRCRELLLQHGVYYAPGRWHAELGAYFSSESAQYDFYKFFGYTDRELIRNSSKKYFVDFRENLEQNTADLLVLSYEGFSTLDESSLEGLRQFIAEYAETCEVIFYARSAISYATSAMSQMVKQGQYVSGEFIASFDSEKVIEKLSVIFGDKQVNIRKFSRESLLNGNVVLDFLSVLSLPDKVCEELSSQVIAENSSLSHEAMLIGNRMIKLLGQEIPVGSLFLDQFSHVLSRIKGQKIKLTGQQFQDLKAIEEYQNHYLLTQYGIVFSSEINGLKVTDNNNAVISDETLDSIAQLLIDMLVPDDQIQYSNVLPLSTTIVSRPRGKIECTEQNLLLRASEEIFINVTVTNFGGESWHTNSAWPICLSYHWKNAANEVVIFDGKRTDLQGVCVLPGQTIVQRMFVVAPDIPGNYCLELTLVQEELAWFETLRFRPTIVGITVLEKYPSLINYFVSRWVKLVCKLKSYFIS